MNKLNFLSARLLLMLCLIFCRPGAHAQNDGSVFVEALGASSTVGVHYDSRFTEHTRWGGRIGLAYTNSRSTHFFATHPDKTTGWSVPVAVNYLCFSGKHRLELGLGMSFGMYQCTYLPKGEQYGKEADQNGIFGFMDIGYRYQPVRGITLRAGFNPGIALWTHDDLGRRYNGVDRAAVVYPYLSIGLKI